MRLAVMGTPDFAVPAFEALRTAGHEIVAAYCQPPRPAGRGHKLQPSPVQRWAEAHGIPVRTPTSLKHAEEQAAFAALGLDAAVVAAYGLILPKPVLEAPRLGCINIHASLLPRWRGAAPIQRAIVAGDSESGVTIMAMDEGLDTGAMLLAEATPIGPDTTGATLHDTLAAIGARLIGPALAGLADGSIRPRPQPADGATYARKLERAESRLDWRRDAAELERTVRAFDPWPGTVLMLEDEPVKLLAAELDGRADGMEPGRVVDDRFGIACGDGGVLRPARLQRPGRAPLALEDFLRGRLVAPGTQLALPDPA